MSDKPKKRPAHEITLDDLERITRGVSQCRPGEDPSLGLSYDFTIINGMRQLRFLRQVFLPPEEIPTICARLEKLAEMCEGWDAKADWEPLLVKLAGELRESDE